MKKILLLFTLLITVSMYVSAKNFYYKGISLEYKKGKLTGSGDESKSINVTGTIGITSFCISAEKLKYDESDTDAVTTYLDEVRTNIENMEGFLRIERTNDIKDGTLNGIEGQQFDIIYRKKNMRLGQRVFCYIQDGWRVNITYTCIGKVVNEKEFASIFKTFNFTPEESGSIY